MSAGENAAGIRAMHARQEPRSDERGGGKETPKVVATLKEELARERVAKQSFKDRLALLLSEP